MATRRIMVAKARQTAAKVRAMPATKPQGVLVRLPADTADRLNSLAKQRGVPLGTLIRVALLNLSRQTRYFDLTTKVDFGKYSGELMEAVIRCDPAYIAWAMRTVDRFELSAPCLSLLAQMERAQRDAA